MQFAEDVVLEAVESGRVTGEFEAIEARLWSILAPYRDRLEEGSVYGLVTLRVGRREEARLLRGRPQTPKHVAFHLMPIYTDPRCWTACRRRCAGA